MRPLEDCRLYTFIDSAFLNGRAPEVIARQLCDGGADLIQIRAKNLPVEEVRRIAELVIPVTRRAGVNLVINDHLEVAQAVGAEFCHLGQEDFFGCGHTHVKELQRPGTRVRIGLSTHAPKQALRAIAAGADYIAIGPVYPTGTKPTAKAVTLDYVRWAAEHASVPWFAIGGINLSNVGEVLDAGARRICVVSAILDAEDATAACRKFRQRLEKV